MVQRPQSKAHAGLFLLHAANPGATRLHNGQVCAISSKSNSQRADKRSGVHFKCAICIPNLLLPTLNMSSVKQSIIRLRIETKSSGRYQNIKCGQINSLEHSSIETAQRWAPKGPEDHRKQPNSFPGGEKPPSQQFARSRTLSRRWVYCMLVLLKSTIKRRLREVNTKGSPQDGNR